MHAEWLVQYVLQPSNDVTIAEGESIQDCRQFSQIYVTEIIEMDVPIGYVIIFFRCLVNRLRTAYQYAKFNYLCLNIANSTE